MWKLYPFVSIISSLLSKLSKRPKDFGGYNFTKDYAKPEYIDRISKGFKRTVSTECDDISYQ